MADELIFVKLISEADTSPAVEALKKEEAELEVLQEELKKSFDHAVKMEQAAKQSVGTADQVAKRVQTVAKAQADWIKEQQKDIQVKKQSIKVLEENAKAINLLEGSTKSARAQLRDMRDLLMQMEESGNTGKTYEELSIRMAKLTDQSSDLQRRINVLASDTKNLDAAMSLGSGLAGAFSTATAAAALLGGENEELQQAFLKVQAAMSVLNGVQQVANALNKDSAASIVFNNALERIRAKVKGQTAAAEATAASATAAETTAIAAQTSATTIATVVQNAFNASMLANPVMWLVAGIAALIGGVVALVSHFKKAAIEARAFADGLDAVKEKNEELKEAGDYAARLAEAEGKGWRDVAKIRQDAANAQLANARKEYNRMLKEEKKAKGRLSDEEREHMKEMKQIVDNAQKEIIKLEQDFHIQEVKEQTDAAAKKEEERKREEEAKKQRGIQAWKQRQAEIKQAEQDLEDVTIALMQDGLAKEIAQIELSYKRKIDAVKNKTEKEKQLRIALETQKEQAIAAARAAAQKKAEEDEEKKKKDEKDEAKAALDKAFQNAKTRIKVTENLLKEERLLRIRAGKDYEEIDAAIAENAKIYRDEEEVYLKNMLDQELITMEDYNQRLADLRGQEIDNITNETKESIDRTKEATEKAIKEAMDTATQALQLFLDLADSVFGTAQDLIGQQIEKLDEMYTTDANEAKKSADKKYITEEEYEKKKAALELRQAKYAKAQAMTDIAIQTALAIITTLAQLGATPWGIAASAVAGATGAASLAVAAAKPLAQYEKGRNGGPGEYALVGEKGPELMYVPQGASIVPNNKLQMPDSWGAYGVPQLALPDRPDVRQGLMEAIAMHQMFQAFDYDKLGKAVAGNIPNQQRVYVNVDRSGVVVADGHDTHTYLNTKYCGAWS